MLFLNFDFSGTNLRRNLRRNLLNNGTRPHLLIMSKLLLPTTPSIMTQFRCHTTCNLVSYDCKSLSLNERVAWLYCALLAWFAFVWAFSLLSRVVNMAGWPRGGENGLYMDTGSRLSIGCVAELRCCLWLVRLVVPWRLRRFPIEMSLDGSFPHVYHTYEPIPFIDTIVVQHYLLPVLFHFFRVLIVSHLHH